MIDIIDLAEDFKRADKKFLKSVASKVLKEKR